MGLSEGSHGNVAHIAEQKYLWLVSELSMNSELSRDANITTLLTNRPVEVINMMMPSLLMIQQTAAVNLLSMKLKWMQLVSILCLLVQTLSCAILWRKVSSSILHPVSDASL